MANRTNTTKKAKKPALSKAEIAAQVQASTGYSISHILKVISGDRNNAEISKAVKTVIKNNK